MRLYKRYVEVIARISKEGKITPLVLVWDNGCKYEIDRVLEIRNAASQVGGCGVLYRCRIQGQERNLYYEINKWFLESVRP